MWNFRFVKDLLKTGTRFHITYDVFFIKFGEVSKPRLWQFKSSYRFEICEVRVKFQDDRTLLNRNHVLWGLWGLWWDLTGRRLMGYWKQVPCSLYYHRVRHLTFCASVHKSSKVICGILDLTYNSLWPSDVIWRHGQHYPREWLVVWQHQTITWIDTDLSPKVFSDINQRAISQDLLMTWIRNIWLEIVHSCSKVMGFFFAVAKYGVYF